MLAGGRLAKADGLTARSGARRGWDHGLLERENLALPAGQRPDGQTAQSPRASSSRSAARLIGRPSFGPDVVEKSEKRRDGGRSSMGLWRDEVRNCFVWGLRPMGVAGGIDAGRTSGLRFWWSRGQEMSPAFQAGMGQGSGPAGGGSGVWAQRKGLSGPSGRGCGTKAQDTEM
jgi:hypothetical protein